MDFFRGSRLKCVFLRDKLNSEVQSLLLKKYTVQYSNRQRSNSQVTTEKASYVQPHLILTTCAVKSCVGNDKTTNKSRKSIRSDDYKTLQVDKFTVLCVCLCCIILCLCVNVKFCLDATHMSKQQFTDVLAALNHGGPQNTTASRKKNPSASFRPVWKPYSGPSNQQRSLSIGATHLFHQKLTLLCFLLSRLCFVSCGRVFPFFCFDVLFSCLCDLHFTATISKKIKNKKRKKKERV